MKKPKVTLSTLELIQYNLEQALKYLDQPAHIKPAKSVIESALSTLQRAIDTIKSKTMVG